MPVVIFLHGNASSRMEGLYQGEVLLEKGINVFAFDFSGSGMSEGEYISLGMHEKDDLKDIIDFVEKLPGVGNIGLWGRSMGAATAIMYMKDDPRVKVACFDSPFSDFPKLANEIAKKMINLSDTILKMALQFMNKTIKDKANADIFQIVPIKNAPDVKIPGIFIHAESDEIVPLQHGLDLYKEYGGIIIYIMHKHINY